MFKKQKFASHLATNCQIPEETNTEFPKLEINQVKDYKCKSFSGKNNKLKLHVKTEHKAMKMNQCESCGKSFSQAGHLKRHIHTVHEVHRDYKCESCGKSFSQAGHLKKHILAVHNHP